MIIEFFGLPGVGKTTVALLLSRNTGWEYIAIDSRTKKLKYVTFFLLRTPLRFLLLFSKTLWECKYSSALMRHKVHLLSEYIARSEKARIEGKKQNVILDEGFAQYGLSLHENDISKLDASKYIEKFVSGKNTIQVIISCENTARIKRMEKRKRIPRARLDINEKAWQEIINKNTQVFADIFYKQGALSFDTLRHDSSIIAETITQHVNNMRKTIIITIIRGMTARNLLRNVFFEILREKFNIIILTPAANDERFIKEFSHPNVKFAYFKECGHSLSDKIFVGLNKYLIYNKFIGLKLKYGIRGLSKPEDLSIFRYWLYTIIFIPLSKIRILRDFVKWLDYLFVQRKEVKEFKDLIRREKPSLVISTSIMSDIETAVIKAAKKMRIRVIGMPKSWDNPSRAGFRAKVDTLVVWSDFMVEQSERFQNYKRKDIKVIGIPQFDYYHDKNRFWSREKFCKELGLDINKKIILFTSEGKSIPEDKEIASTIYDFIKNNELIKECQLLIRPHFSYKDEVKKFTHLLEKQNVVIDLSNNPSSCFRDHADYSWYHMERFVNSLHHADVVVNVASTIALDGIALDRPVIHFAYDVNEKNAKSYPLKLCYASDYNLEIVKTGATKLANSRNEFRDLINRYLKDPSLESKERAHLREKFCYRVDGNSGKRFANVIIDETANL